MASEQAGSPQVAGDYATASVPVASPGDDSGPARQSLLGERYELATHLVVLDDRMLVGLVALEDLLAADPGVRIEELTGESVPTVPSQASPELAASRMAEQRTAALAVVDERRHFIGLIPPQRMLGVLLKEHEEDLARIGGFRAGSGQALRAAQESVSQRLRHRLGWLLIGAIGAMLSALLIGLFEEELDRKVVLAFFVPAVVYLAAAVGTQTQAILIRGLSVGVTLSQVARRELLTGTIAGAVIALLFAPFALIFFGDASVALALGLALLVSCAAATVIAMALPWMFQRLGKDPAFGSGPLATVLQDLLSIAIYLAIAIPMAG
jgi:magnesium transporter